MFLEVDGGLKIINTDEISSICLYLNIKHPCTCLKMKGETKPIWLSTQDFVFIKRNISPTVPTYEDNNTKIDSFKPRGKRTPKQIVSNDLKNEDLK